MGLNLYRLVFGVAEVLQVALGAFGLAGNADAAPMPDQLMGKLDPAILRDHFH